MVSMVDRYQSLISNRGAVTCAQEQTPHVTMVASAHLRSKMSDCHGSARAEDTICPAARRCARVMRPDFGESV